MDTPVITAITLPAETVHQAIAAWLSANVFRSPIAITSIESDGEVYSIALEPAPGPIVETGHFSDLGDWIVDKSLPRAHGHNGNGVGAGLVPAQPSNLQPATVVEVAPVPTGAPKRKPRSGNRTSPAIAAQVLALSAAGELSVHRIALACGVSDSTVYAIRLEARQAAAAAAEADGVGQTTESGPQGNEVAPQADGVGS